MSDLERYIARRKKRDPEFAEGFGTGYKLFKLRGDHMEIDYDKIDDYTLALLYLVTSENKYGARAWKSFDWETMNRLHEKGYISNPKSKALSIALSEEGLSRAKELFEKFFAK
jgi:hypothetical protein